MQASPSAVSGLMPAPERRARISTEKPTLLLLGATQSTEPCWSKPRDVEGDDRAAGTRAWPPPVLLWSAMAALWPSVVGAEHCSSSEGTTSRACEEAYTPGHYHGC